MKITAVTTYVLKSPLQTPFAFSQGWVRQRAATIVEVVTDQGLSGWVEALCVGMQPPEIAAATIASALAPLLIGADPREPEVLWRAMYNRTRVRSKGDGDRWHQCRRHRAVGSLRQGARGAGVAVARGRIRGAKTASAT